MRARMFGNSGLARTVVCALAVLFFAAAAGAAFEVVLEVGRYVARKASGGLTSPYVLGGFLAGVIVMYVTGVLAA